MVAEAQIKSQSKDSAKEFEKLLNEDFKDRKLKENQIGLSPFIVTLLPFLSFGK